MPNAKGQQTVYVSSTFIDLQEHRAVLLSALEKARYDVECMEKYTAFDERPLDRCLADVAAADVYVLLIAHRYGYRPPESNPQRRSITHLEYEEACRRKKIRLLFTLDRDQPWPAELIDENADSEDLSAFRAEVEKNIGVHRFSTPDKLANLVLQVLQAHKPASMDAHASRDRRYTSAELQAWMERHQARLSAAFLALPSVQTHQLHVPLDVRLTLAGAAATEGPRLLRPEDLEPLLASTGSHELRLSGDGGTGKTSLAFAIARWWLQGEPGGVVRLPVLIETPLKPRESVADRVRTWLRGQLAGVPEGDLEPALVEALLASKRLIPIVDRFSELKAIDRWSFLAVLPPGLVVVTSRSEDDSFKDRPLSRIEPCSIALSCPWTFCREYLHRKNQEAVLSDDDLISCQTQLRWIVGDKPIPVLLAKLFIDSIASRDPLRDPPQWWLDGLVSGLMRTYVRCLLPPVDFDQRRMRLEYSESRVERALRVVALASYRQGPQDLPLFHSQEFSDTLALSALMADEPVGLGLEREGAEALLGYLIELRLLLQPEATAGRLRFPQDLVADHLAAAEQLDQLRAQTIARGLEHGTAVWEEFVALLEQRPEEEREQMRGFLLALRDSAMGARGDRFLAMPLEVSERLEELGFLDPEREGSRQLQRRVREVISKLESLDGASRRQARVLADVLNELQAERWLEQKEAALVLGLIGMEAEIETLEGLATDRVSPPELRRAALEALGLTARDHASTRQRIERFLEAQLRADALDLMMEDEAGWETGWAEHDRRLAVLQGASRGLQVAASASLPLLGSGPGHAVPMLTLTALREGEGLRIRTQVVMPAVWKLPLPGGEQLELVMVPGGDAVIGSPETEDGRRAYYLHYQRKCEGVNVEALRPVNLKTFALVRHPLTQAQWRAVASLPRLEHDIRLNPGTHDARGLWERHAQPGCLPVDSVSWRDCQEWLRRLNRWLEEQWPQLGGQGENPRLALPSEDQWEVACRAGSRTPFHFGDTIDASWANYNGEEIHVPGRQGAFRQRPVPAGFFGLVNRWGLAEMHGQLLEWCADRWHRDPLAEARGDGSAREDPDPELLGDRDYTYRMLRGGSWFVNPYFCRASFRLQHVPDCVNYNNGFRPGCFFPASLFLGH